MTGLYRTLLTLVLVAGLGGVAHATIQEPTHAMQARWLDADTVEIEVFSDIPGQDVALSVLEDAAGLTLRQVGTNLFHLDLADGASPRDLRFALEGGGARSQLRHRIERPRRTLGTAEMVIQEGEPGKRALRNIRIHGSLGYVGIDGFIRYADAARIEVVDEDGIGDSVLYNGSTNPDGSFDFNFDWDDGDLFDPQPDLRLRFYAENTYAKILYNDLFNHVYSWEFNLGDNFTGTDIFITPRVTTNAAALYANTTLARGGRYLASLGHVASNVDVKWPSDSDNSHYRRPPVAGIQIVGDAIWSDQTLMHEFGHHFNQLFSGFPSGGGYCNDTCDDGRCGHCFWCPENQSYTWTEGYASFIAYIAIKDLEANYIPGPYRGFNPEWIGGCAEPEGVGPSDMVEGFVTALLVDCVDSSNENDPTMDDTVSDESTMTVEDVLGITVDYHPDSPQELLDSIESYLRFSGSYPAGELSRFWATAKNGGFEIDDEKPTNPTSLVCTTHNPGVSSPGSMVQFTWSGAADATSGIAGYSVVFNAGLALPPSTTTMNTTDPNTWTTPAPVAPGSYWFTLRAFDRSGKSATGHLTVGPIVVGSPVAVNLTKDLPEFWTGALVLTQTPGAGTPTTPNPLLPTVNSYLHYAFWNPTAGSLALDDPFTVYIGRNGSGWAPEFDPGIIVAAAEYEGVVDVGVLPGGRHTFRMRIDTRYEVAESNENDNNWVRQFVVQPQLFNPPDDYTRTGMPVIIRTATEVDTPIGAFYTSTSGVRVRSDGWWNAYVLYTADNALENPSNADLSLFDVLNTGPENGFQTPLRSSTSPEGELDAILVNRNNVGNREWDLGATQVRMRTASPNLLHHVRSTQIPFGAETAVTIEPFPRLELREFFVDTPDLGPFTMRVTVPPGSPTLEVKILNSDVTTTALSSMFGAETDSNGVATVVANLTTAGYYCLAIWGTPDPYGLYKNKAANDIVASVYVGGALPDMQPDHFVQQWAKPLVPRRLPDGTPGAVPAPDYLIGDTASTYLNTALVNLGNAGIPFLSTSYRVDGGGLTSFGIGPLNPYHQILFNDSIARTVPAGRHTLGMFTDHAGNVLEGNEDNNKFAWQWAWRPPVMASETPVTRTAPFLPDGGTTWIPRTISYGPDTGNDGGPLLQVDPVIWPNCDGLRANHADLGVDGQWWGAAILPTLGMPLQLNLHEAVDDAVTGFTETLVSSHSGGPNEIEFVLVNHRETPHRQFDLGVVNEVDSRWPYTALSTASVFLDTNPSGPYGPFTLGANLALDLHEVWLDPGTWDVDMLGLDGQADLGFSVHRPRASNGEPYHARLDPDGSTPAAWLEPSGVVEKLQFSVGYGEEGYYCVAVWRPRTSVPMSAESYTLDFAFTPAVAEYIGIDGQLDGVYGAPVSVQTTQTGFGDNQLADIDLADGSELDVVHATLHDDVLYLLFAGNLESNFNSLEIFLDTTQGGQQKLRGDNPVTSMNGLNRMGDQGQGDGFTFDPGFEPDHYFSVIGGDDPYRCHLEYAELLSSGGGVFGKVGQTTAGPYGVLVGGDNPHGIRMSIDNSNVAGVAAGNGAGNGTGVTTGIELAIPLAALGNPGGCMTITAFINGVGHDYVSNQFLSPLPAGTANLGEPRNVDLGNLAGDQSFSVCAVTAIGHDPAPGWRHGVELHAAVPNPFNPRTTLSFRLDAAADVELAIYDVSGRLVVRLIEGTQLSAGTHQVEWDGKDATGRTVASGSYFSRLSAGGVVRSGRMALLK